MDDTFNLTLVAGGLTLGLIFGAVVQRSRLRIGADHHDSPVDIQTAASRRQPLLEISPHDAKRGALLHAPPPVAI